MFYQYLGKQLSQVNGSYYPPSIVEWAEINDLPLEDAYQELKMSYESAGIIIMRINAVWRKYVNLINSITEEEYNASDITAQFEAALRFGSTK